jgi:hypothetical protein
MIIFWGFAPVEIGGGAARQLKRHPNGEPEAHRKVLRQRRVVIFIFKHHRIGTLPNCDFSCLGFKDPLRALGQSRLEDGG